MIIPSTSLAILKRELDISKKKLRDCLASLEELTHHISVKEYEITSLESEVQEIHNTINKLKGS